MTDSKPGSRRRSREFALQGVYQWLLSGEEPGVVHAHIADIKGFNKCDLAHFDALLHGAIREADSLRALFTPHLDRPRQPEPRPHQRPGHPRRGCPAGPAGQVARRQWRKLQAKSASSAYQ